jgi:signal transduction histidine kinase
VIEDQLLKSDINQDNSPLLAFFAGIVRQMPAVFRTKKGKGRPRVRSGVDRTASDIQIRKGAEPPIRRDVTDNEWVSLLVFDLFRDNPERQDALLIEMRGADSLVGEFTAREAQRETIRELIFLFSRLEELGAQFNEQIAPYAELKRSTITGTGFVGKPMDTKRMGKTNDGSYRCRITCGTNTLVLRGEKKAIDIFFIPSNQLFLGAKAETKDFLHGRFTMRPTAKGHVWCFEGVPTSVSERVLIMRSLFRDLILKAKQAEEVLARNGPTTWNEVMEQPPSVQDLLLTKLMLIRKLVNRHEEITNAISRDLHDVVIGDIMLLKRRVSEGSAVPPEEIISVLDRVSKEVREISYNLSPRDLDDWGLSTVLEDLLERVRKQTTAHCTFASAAELPQLERDVQLQIFRIVQESLNNAAKHANAEQIFLSIDVVGKILRVMVMDDGDGFDVDNIAKDETSGVGGTGLSGLKERAELIRCFHPVTLTIDSEPGNGTDVLLEVSFGEN